MTLNASAHAMLKIDKKIPITVEWDADAARFLLTNATTGERIPYASLTYEGHMFGPDVFEFEIREASADKWFVTTTRWVVRRTLSGSREAHLQAWEVSPR